MGSLAKQLGGQSQVKVFAKGGKVAATKPTAKFEKTKRDLELKANGKEGSAKEEAFDKKQMKARGGKVCK